MIERYLYRGKRIIDGEWINGHYCLDDFDKPSIIALRYNGYKMYDEVVPATLGQCTGDKENSSRNFPFSDKNGTLISSEHSVRESERIRNFVPSVHYGDMLRVTNWRRIGVVTFCHAMFKFDNVSLCTFFGDKDYSVEVIGNTKEYCPAGQIPYHDKSDLLNGGDTE